MCVVVSDCSLVHSQCTECIGETIDTDCTVCADGWFADSGDCTGMYRKIMSTILKATLA